MPIERLGGAAHHKMDSAAPVYFACRQRKLWAALIRAASRAKPPGPILLIAASNQRACTHNQPALSTTAARPVSPGALETTTDPLATASAAFTQPVYK